MAMRYSGQVTVTLAYDNKRDQYTTLVDSPGGRERVRVGAVRGKVVDAPEVMDDAARAAISFAERTRAGEYAAHDAEGSTYHIGRMKSRAWPRETKKTRKGALAGVLAALRRLE